MGNSAVQLQTQLRPDERLLWSGVPDPRVWLTPADGFLIPFSILWTAFAFFWELNAVNSGGPAFMVLWGIPFVAMGVYFVAGRFVYKRYRKQRTAYGITTQRAIIAGPRAVADMPLYQRAVTVRRSRDSRHANVLFDAAAAPAGMGGFSRTTSSFYSNTGMELFARSAPLAFAFYDVADPEAMLQALDQARTQPANPGW